MNTPLSSLQELWLRRPALILVSDLLCSRRQEFFRPVLSLCTTKPPFWWVLRGEVPRITYRNFLTSEISELRCLTANLVILRPFKTFSRYLQALRLTKAHILLFVWNEPVTPSRHRKPQGRQATVSQHGQKLNPNVNCPPPPCFDLKENKGRNVKAWRF